MGHESIREKEQEKPNKVYAVNVLSPFKVEPPVKHHAEEQNVPRPLTDEEVSDFRERLCAAAERLFAEQGPRAASMRQLAAKLGVSPMTPYRYFKDKDDILAAVRASGFN